MFGTPDEAYLVHLITTRPDFDQIVLVTVPATLDLSEPIEVTVPTQSATTPLVAGELVDVVTPDCESLSIGIDREIYLEHGRGCGRCRRALRYDSPVSTYRDDLEAAQARADALAREVAELRSEKAAREAQPQAMAVTAPTSSSAETKPGNYGAWHRLRYDLARWPTWRKITLIGCIVATVVTIVALLAEQSDRWNYFTIASAAIATICLGLSLGSPASD